VKRENWGAVYAECVQTLSTYIQEARLTLCGLSTCLDGYLRLHEAERLWTAEEGTPEAALSRELLRRASCGIGGEWDQDWPEGGMWLEEKLKCSRWGLGGTGAQAGQTLAILGAPALMSLEDRSERQLSVIDPNVRVATDRGVLRCGDLSPVTRRKPAHYIFEYTSGTRVGPIIPKRSSRTIVRFTGERLDNDPDFTRESIAAAANAGAAILSGFNEIGQQDIEAALSDTVTLAHAWRDRGLRIIHLELGDYASVHERDTVLETLRGAFTSLGMSYSELRAFCLGSRDPVSKAYELSETLNLSRLCVHADTWALAITKDDPHRELEALLCGCLLASARAQRGKPCLPTRVPADVEFHDPPLETFVKSGERMIVCCASPYLERPVATIGLGDTFLAGTLLVLGGRSPTLAKVPY
jgi:ADP-dependent phosphofructokinase/glucokinase